MPVTIPPSLRPGDTVALVAPGAAVKNPLGLSRAVQFYQSLGLNVTIFPSCGMKRYKEQNGTKLIFCEEEVSDAQKLRELQKCFCDDTIKGIFCVRGGYGCIRLLQGLSKNVFAENPKVFCGYSDITFLHLWFVLHAGLVTFHAPMALADFSDIGTAKQRLTCASFAQMICRKNRTVFTFPMNVWTTGEAGGRLIGGNLSCVCAFVSTSFWTEPDEPFLLFIEEVNEPLYRVERMLWVLHYRGFFSKVCGIVFGSFTMDGCNSSVCSSKTDRHTCRDLLIRFFSTYYPHMYLASLPFVGHTSPNFTLPLGAMARADQHRLQIELS